jgi:hypothetical protein
MAIGESLIRLVRRGDADEDLPSDLVDTFALELTGTPEPEPFDAPAIDPARLQEPGFADIEAAVALVSAGLARRVILSSFPSWPGLLWRAYQLAEEANVLILPTVVRPGGRVDIVVTEEGVE